MGFLPEHPKIHSDCQRAAGPTYWKNIGCNSKILDVISEGYRIPFHSTPSKSFSPNNKSALIHRTFVDEALYELLRTSRVKIVKKRPHVINPLSVAERHGKLRLILDLRKVNLHVFKDKVRFDDWKVMEDFVEKGDFGFKFDISQGYHHIDIHEDFQTYLGFSWPLDGIPCYYIFSVLPFGLTSAPSIFTKTVRVLMKSGGPNQ